MASANSLLMSPHIVLNRTMFSKGLFGFLCNLEVLEMLKIFFFFQIILAKKMTREQLSGGFCFL